MRITFKRSGTHTAILCSLKHRYAVAVIQPGSEIKNIDLREDDDITVERLDEKPLGNVLRRLENIREEFDTDPDGFAARLVVISAEVARHEWSSQFLARSFATVRL